MEVVVGRPWTKDDPSRSWRTGAGRADDGGRRRARGPQGGGGAGHPWGPRSRFSHRCPPMRVRGDRYRGPFAFFDPSGPRAAAAHFRGRSATGSHARTRRDLEEGAAPARRVTKALRNAGVRASGLPARQPSQAVRDHAAAAAANEAAGRHSPPYGSAGRCGVSVTQSSIWIPSGSSRETNLECPRSRTGECSTPKASRRSIHAANTCSFSTASAK